VDEWTTRLPSVLCTIATALAVFLVARRMVGPPAGLAGGALFLVTLEVFSKGGLGELEAQLCLFTFLAIAALWFGAVGTLRWSLLSGPALGLALLTKGPPVMLFFCAALVALAVLEPRARRAGWVALWLPTVLGLAIVGVWVGLLVGSFGAGEALEIWRGEVLDRGKRDVVAWLVEHGEFLLGLAAGLLPGSLLVGLLHGTDAWKQAAARPAFRFVLWTVLGSVLLLAVAPGVRVRYAYPLAPWVALLAGWLVERVVAAPLGALGSSRLRWTAVTTGGLGILAALLATLVGSIEGMRGLGPLGFTLCALVVVLGVLAIVRRRDLTPARALATIVGVLVLGRVLYVATLLPALVEKRGQVATLEADALRPSVPEGRTLHTNVWGLFNELWYLDREIRWVDDPRDVAAGELLLVKTRVADELRATSDPAPVVLARPTLEEKEFVLLTWPVD
jgi:4-amino-4-deoxy-L-arabinose transferase-like glycosyltransferase